MQRMYQNPMFCIIFRATTPFADVNIKIFLSLQLLKLKSNVGTCTVNKEGKHNMTTFIKSETLLRAWEAL